MLYRCLGRQSIFRNFFETNNATESIYHLLLYVINMYILKSVAKNFDSTLPYQPYINLNLWLSPFFTFISPQNLCCHKIDVFSVDSN